MAKSRYASILSLARNNLRNLRRPVIAEPVQPPYGYQRSRVSEYRTFGGHKR